MKTLSRIEANHKEGGYAIQLSDDGPYRFVSADNLEFIAMNKITEFVIPRDKLIRFIFCDEKGCKCAMGWYLSACGISDVELKNNYKICYDVAEVTVGSDFFSRILYQNDLYDSYLGGKSKKEENLIKGFAESGIKLIFK